MHFQNLFTAHHIGVRNDHLTVKAAGTQQRRVKNIRTVGCGNQDHTFVRLKTIHFDKHLVERLLTLVIATTKSGATMPTNRINFIDENNTGSILLSLFEHVTNTARTDTNKHLDKIGARNGEERYICLTSDSLCEQGFTCSRRPNKQNTLWDFTAKSLKLPGIFQEFDNFFELGLCFIDTGHILKGDSALMFGQQFRP